VPEVARSGSFSATRRRGPPHSPGEVARSSRGARGGLFPQPLRPPAAPIRGRRAAIGPCARRARREMRRSPAALARAGSRGEGRRRWRDGSMLIRLVDKIASHGGRAAVKRGTAVPAVGPAGILPAALHPAGGTPAGPTGRMPVPLFPPPPLRRPHFLSGNRISLDGSMLIRLPDTDGLGEAFDNSPALQRWVKAPKTRKVPSETTERFFRPCGTLLSWVRAVPSAEALGYFHGIPPFHTRVVKQPDKQGWFCRPMRDFAGFFRARHPALKCRAGLWRGLWPAMQCLARG